MLSFYQEFPDESTVKTLLEGDAKEFLFVLARVPERYTVDNPFGKEEISVSQERLDGLAVRLLPDGAVTTGRIRIVYPHVRRSENGEVTFDPGEIADLKPFTVYRTRGTESSFLPYSGSGTEPIFAVWDVPSLLSDPELEELAAFARKNQVINTDLGDLTIHRDIESFLGRAESLGVNISISYEGKDPLLQEPVEREERFAPAVDVMNRVVTQEMLGNACRFAAKEALPTANEWRHDVAEAEGRSTPAPEWTVEDVVERFRAVYVSVMESGEICIELDDGYLFGGHPVTVFADEDGTPTEVELDV